MTSAQVTGRGSQTGSASRHRLSQLGLSRVTGAYRSVELPIAIGWVGVLLRVAWYAERRPLWLDEAMLARPVIGESLRALVSTPLGDGQVAPIGFLVLERAAVVVFGGGELALRVVPLVAGILSIVLFLAVARRTLREEAVPMAMALFAANRALVAYAAEAKQYSTDVAVALGLWALWLVVRERGTSRGGAVAVAGVGAMAVWLSQPAVLVLAGLWGATLVLDRQTDGWAARRRMSAAAVVWGASGAAAAWVAWTRVTASDRAYLRAFWSDGFPDSVWWPLAAPARAFDHLLRVPPGVVWLVLVMVGLWIAVNARVTARDRALLLGVGPVIAAMIAAALGFYPFADRLVLFLVPLALLLIAQIRARALLVVCLVLPQLVVSFLPVRHEDMRTIARALALQRAPGDAVYVYYGGAPAFTYYAAKTAVFGGPDRIADGSYDIGACHRGDLAGYFRELDRYEAPQVRGRRLWLIVGHAYRGEDSAIARHLGQRRAVMATVTANDAFARLYGADTGGEEPVVRPLPFETDSVNHGLACRK
jgi:hypothetical protein